MKHKRVNAVLSDEEYKALLIAKLDKTWREWMLEKADQQMMNLEVLGEEPRSEILLSKLAEQKK